MKPTRMVAAIALVVAAVVVGASPPSGAIVGGAADRKGHPNAAFFEAYDAAGAPLFYCTGTLVAPTVIVTAAHCTGGDPTLGVIASMQATFEPTVRGATPLAVASWHPHPDYRLPTKTGTSQFIAEQPTDIGVVVLADPPAGVTPAPITPAGSLTTAKKQTTSFTLVGYGAERELDQPNKPTFVSPAVRNTTTSGFKSLDSGLLYLNGNFNNALDTGGICAGDSGGPVFDGPTIVAVDSFGQHNCQNTSGHVRLDSPLARTFLAPYAPLP